MGYTPWDHRHQRRIDAEQSCVAGPDLLGEGPESDMIAPGRPTGNGAQQRRPSGRGPRLITAQRLYIPGEHQIGDDRDPEAAPRQLADQVAEEQAGLDHVRFEVSGDPPDGGDRTGPGPRAASLLEPDQVDSNLAFR